MSEFFIYSPENLLKQSEQTELERGYHKLRFFVDEQGMLSKHATSRVGDFYYSPSGGTLRDSELNIVLYSAKFDKFKNIAKSE